MKKLSYLGSIVFMAMLTVLSVAGFGYLKADQLKGQVEAANYIESANTVNYVSLGDSITSGYGLSGYSTSKEFGASGYSGTTLVLSESYTGKIDAYLKSAFGDGNVKTISYAHSGDRISHLLSKLDNADVKKSIQNADLVTICIGANNVLSPALERIFDFVGAGSSMTVDTMLEGLYSGIESAKTEYPQLLNKLYSINPNAQYVFTTVYNPFRGFGITYKDIKLAEIDPNWFLPGKINLGFTSLSVPDIPSIPITINESILLDSVINANRVNIVDKVTDTFLKGGSTSAEGKSISVAKGLNQIINESVTNFNKGNFSVVDIYTAFNNLSNSPAMSDSDKFRGGPGTSREDKGVVNAWLNTEKGVVEICLELRNADWQPCWDAGWNNAVAEIGRIGWTWDWINNFGGCAGRIVSAYTSAWLDAAGKLIWSEMQWAVDPHPTRNGHTIIKDELIKKIALIKFNAMNGNNVKKGEISKVGQKITQPTNPTRTGYIFNGWFKESACTNAWNFNSNTVPANTTEMTLYAKWTPIQYSVAFNANGGTGSMSTITGRVYDTTYTLPAEAFTKTLTTTYNLNDGSGRTTSDTSEDGFAGWATSQNGDVAYYDQGNYNNLTSSNGATVTLYAKWDNAAMFTLPTPTRSGYSFSGWYSAASGGSFVGGGGASYVGGGKTLYAHWEEGSYMVTYASGGGKITANSAYVGSNSTHATKSLKYNTSYTTPIAPSLSTMSKPGYDFEGYYLADDWRTKSSKEEYFNSDAPVLRIGFGNVSYPNTFFSTTRPYVYGDIQLLNGPIAFIDVNDSVVSPDSCLIYYLSPDRTRLKFLYKISDFDVDGVTRPYRYDQHSFIDINIESKANLTSCYVIHELWTSTFATQVITEDGYLKSDIGGYTGANQTWQRADTAFFAPKWKTEYYDVSLVPDNGMYTVLDYIQSTGTQYINTGVVLNMNTDGYEVTAQATSNTQNGMILGDWSISNNYYWLYHYYDGKIIRMYLTNSSGNQVYFETGLNNTNLNKNTYRYENKRMYVNGALASNLSSTSFSTAKGSCYVFGCNYSGGGVGSWPYIGRIYGLKMYKAGTMVRNYVPVKNASGEVGLLDLVTHEFYGNIGTGEFIAGPEKGQFDFLGYIESTGTQYIDTGYADAAGIRSTYKAEFLDVAGGYIVGSHNLDYPYGRNGAYWSERTQWEFGYGETCPPLGVGTTDTLYEVDFKTTSSEAYLKVKGGNYSNWTTLISTSGQAISSYNNWLFYNQYSKNLNGPTTKARVYYAQIYSSNNVLVRDYVPVKKPDGTIGMFDLVNKVFYGNSGSGTFLGGYNSGKLNDTYGPLPTPSRTGYKFDYWQTNLFDPSMEPYVEDHYYNGSTGVYTRHPASGEAEYDTYKAYLVPGATYTLKNSGKSTAPGYGIFDSNGNLIVKQNYANTTDITFTAPANASYIVFSVVTQTSSSRYDKPYFSIFGKVDSSTRISKPANQQLTAKWTPNTYTVVYNGNGSTSGETQNSYHTYDVAANLTANGFSRIGYRFVGWSTSPNGTTYSLTSSNGSNGQYSFVDSTVVPYASGNYSDGQSVKNLTAVDKATVILYAQWEVIEYTVTLDANGGSVNPTSEAVAYMANYGSLPTPTRANYRFDGWSTNLFHKDMELYKENIYYNGKDGSYVEYEGYGCYISYLLPNTTYTLINSGGSTAPGYGIFDGSGKLLAKANYNNQSTITFTTPANSSYIVYSVRISSTHEPHRYDKEYFAINGIVDSSIKMVKPVNHTLTAEWTPLNHNVYFVNNVIDETYYQLEYIESTGAQWINTGISQGARWEYDIEFTKLNTRQLMGYGGSSDEYWGIANAGYYEIYSSVGVKAGNRDKVTHVYACNGESALYINEKKVRTTGGAATLGEYVMFALGNGSAPCYSKLYGCQVYNASGTLIRDFVPVLNKTTYTVGLLDKVNNRFYGSVGSESFKPGFIKEVTYGETYGELPTPTKTGQDFNGWYTDANGGTKLSSSATVTSVTDEFYFADWSNARYTVRFDPNKGHVSLLFFNGDFESVTTKTNVGWDNSLNGTIIPDTGWDTGYNSDVTNPTKGYHAHIAKFGDNHVVRFKTNESITGLDWNRWLGVYRSLGTNLQAGRKYRITMDVYRVSGDGAITVGIWNSAANKYEISPTSLAFYATENGKWTTVYKEFTMPSYTASDGLRFYIYGHNAPGEIYVDNVSIVDLTVPLGFQASITYGENYRLNFTPVRLGYLFDGWYTQATGGTKVTTSTKVTTPNDHTLYAHWTPINYTISYNANGGDAGSTAASTHVYDTSKALTTNGFTRVGYAFAGWNTKADGTGTSYTNAQSVKNLCISNGGNVELFAQWKVNVYRVGIVVSNPSYGYVTNAANKKVDQVYIENVPYGSIIEVNGDEITICSQTYKAIPAARTAQYTYEFSTWEFLNGEVVEGDATILLHFNPVVNKYTITFRTSHPQYTALSSLKIENVEYGSIVDIDDKHNTVIRVNNSNVEALSVPLPGYSAVFKNWSVADGYVVKGDVTITANFEIVENTYYIEYNANGGTGTMDRTEHDYSVMFSMIDSNFTRKAYSFVGWNTAADGSGTGYQVGDRLSELKKYNNEVLTLYAQWEANPAYLHNNWKRILTKAGISSRKIREIEFLTSPPASIAEGSTYEVGSSVSDDGNVNANVVAWVRESLGYYDVKFFSLAGVEILAQTNLSNYFEFFDSLRSIKFDNFNTSEVTDISWMFSYCESLRTLDLSGWDTSNVTNMMSMFEFCTSLETIEGINSFDLTSLEFMHNMFVNCSSLTSLDLSNWNTENVLSFNNVFAGCVSLKELNISNFDLSRVGESEYHSADGMLGFGAENKINKLFLPKNLAGNELEITTLSYMVEIGTQNCVVSETTSIVPEHQGKVLVRANAIGATLFNGETLSELDGWIKVTAYPEIWRHYVEYNQPVGEIPTVSKMGWEFTGWNTESDGTGTTITPTTNIDGMNTVMTYIYPQMRVINYSIAYNLDGGEVDGTNPTTYNVDTETFTLINPTREGYVFLGWTGSNGSTPSTTVRIEKGSVGDKTYTANWKIAVVTVRIQLSNSNYGTITHSIVEKVPYGSTITFVDNKFVIRPSRVDDGTITTDVEVTATPKAFDGTYYYQFSGWTANGVGGVTRINVLEDVTITATLLRLVEISVSSSGASGNTYGLDVYNENGTLIHNNKTGNFKLETDKIYTIKAVYDLIKDEERSDHQILRVYVDEVLSKTRHSLECDSEESTIVNRQALSSPFAVRFEYIESYFIEVEVMENSIGGMTIDELNIGNDVILKLLSYGGYMVSVGTKVVFSVNATPISEPASTFIGFNYEVADGNSYTVGVNGGTDIKYETFTHNNQYTNDSNVGTYTYSIVGNDVRKISALTIQSFKVDVNTEGLTGKVTLTSQHGFNKVIDSSTEYVTLYAGEWTVTGELTLAEVQEMFPSLSVVQKEGKIVVDVKFVS